MKDADEAVGELSAGGVVAGAAGALVVVVGLGSVLVSPPVRGRSPATAGRFSWSMWCQGWVRPGLVSRSCVESRVVRRVSRAAEAVTVR